MENVAAIRSRGLGRVLGDLAEIGYDAAWVSLRASDVGAAHRRERVFILAYSHEARSQLAAADATGQRHAQCTTACQAAAARPPGRPERRHGQPVWGAYEPAIRSWEGVIGRLAPAPTELGTRGQARLAPTFSEWLMGLPAGFVTGLGLPYGAQLHMLGNGVVPQQAEVALRYLVTVIRRYGGNA